jgi:hypothetical protein
VCKPRLRELCITQAMEDGMGGRGAAGDAACGWEEDGDSTQHAVPDDGDSTQHAVPDDGDSTQHAVPDDGDSTQHAVPDATTGRLVFATTGRATLEEQANNQRRPAPQRPSPYRAQRAGVSYEIKSPPKLSGPKSSPLTSPSLSYF